MGLSGYEICWEQRMTVEDSLSEICIIRNYLLAKRGKKALGLLSAMKGEAIVFG